jgi:hypothetical protein
VCGGNRLNYIILSQAIAAAMEAKTMAEIIAVNLVPTVTCGGQAGVQAIVETNIARFVGDATFSPLSESDEDIFRDLSEILARCQETLTKKDPRNMADVDSVISGIDGITSPIKLALSIACCKAGARHKVLGAFERPFLCSGGEGMLVLCVRVSRSFATSRSCMEPARWQFLCP